ncbi:unnamed protein product [marine sediment metagenome]|uniref:Uncharacterized protein n=1 Tax=marine sediment metagenome TaxID=412755 RepID=X1JQ73_9ZZZZ
MRSVSIVFFCTMYLLIFSVLGSLIGVVVFPPPAMAFGFWGVNISLSFWNAAALLGVIATLLVLFFGLSAKIAGSGIDFDMGYMVTIGVGLFVGGLLAWTMIGMMPTVPIQATALLTWPFVLLLIYGIVTGSRGGGG